MFALEKVRDSVEERNGSTVRTGNFSKLMSPALRKLKLKGNIFRYIFRQNIAYLSITNEYIAIFGKTKTVNKCEMLVQMHNAGRIPPSTS